MGLLGHIVTLGNTFGTFFLQPVPGTRVQMGQKDTAVGPPRGRLTLPPGALPGAQGRLGHAGCDSGVGPSRRGGGGSPGPSAAIRSPCGGQRTQSPEAQAVWEQESQTLCCLRPSLCPSLGNWPCYQEGGPACVTLASSSGGACPRGRPQGGAGGQLYEMGQLSPLCVPSHLAGCPPCLLARSVCLGSQTACPVGRPGGGLSPSPRGGGQKPSGHLERPGRPRGAGRAAWGPVRRSPAPPPPPHQAPPGLRGPVQWGWGVGGVGGQVLGNSGCGSIRPGVGIQEMVRRQPGGGRTGAVSSVSEHRTPAGHA